MEKISLGREYDRANRIYTLTNMETCLRLFSKTGDSKFYEEARGFGEHARKMKERMEKHDYAEDDADWERVLELEIRQGI